MTVAADLASRAHAFEESPVPQPAGVPAAEHGAGATFVVDLGHFNGPLDLLLTLLREEQIDIYDIPIARVAEQFLARIQSLRLDEAADYLEMAARLLRIKAQMLLPRRDGDEAWDDPRAELVRRLLEYQQIREVVDLLEARAELRRARFARPPLPATDRLPAATPAPLAAALADLLGAVDRVLRMTRGPIVHTVIPRALDVAGALDAARLLLARRQRVHWGDLVGTQAEPWQILSVLLALLELARLGECVLRQPSPFGGLEIAGTSRGASASHDSAGRVGAPGPPSVFPPTSDITHDTPGAAA